MSSPPTKRLRSTNQDDDPFGDDDDFTQDDFDEIDIIASQAFTSASASEVLSKPRTRPTELVRGSARASSWGQSKTVSRSTTESHGRDNALVLSNRATAQIPNREPHGRSIQQPLGSDRENSYSLLQSRHAELERKINEMEEKIDLKSGEIQVLRDSLKRVQQEKEDQRQNQLLLETQRQKEQSDKEKELNRKIQALESELHFKGAEINEMKTKLLIISDKNKVASPASKRNAAQMHHGYNNNSSTNEYCFITKEKFGAHVPSTTTTVKMPPRIQKDAGDRGSSSNKSGDCQEVSWPDPFLFARPAHLQHPGTVLLGLLLQQPISPSSLGLSNLLSMSQTDIPLASSGLLTGLLPYSDGSSSRRDGGAPRTAQSPKSLALAGLNMLSQSQPDATGSNRNTRSCPGAVLLLPLLDLHLSQVCHQLDSLCSTAVGGSDSSVTSSFPAGHAVPAARLVRTKRAGLTGFSLKDTGLAVLRILSLLLTHSDEAVEAVLPKESQSRAKKEKAERSATGLDLCSQNALLQSLLRLCEADQDSSDSTQSEGLVLSAIKTLCVLIERTPRTHTDRLQCVLPVVCVCLSGDSRLQTISACVTVLMYMSEYTTLVQQLCSQHDPCVFLKLFQFVKTRPDKKGTHADWVRLDLQVVRLLSRVLTQREESWTSSQHSACQCYTELVQTVVIIFHRQWLNLCEHMDLTGPALPLQQRPTLSLHWGDSTVASVLRECLLLLHWLLLHHRSFSESCRPLLHMYDQMIPAVRDMLSQVLKLSESEEQALEEICRSEGDESDDMDTDIVN